MGKTTDRSTFTAAGNPYDTRVTVDQIRNMLEDVQAALRTRLAYGYSDRVVKKGKQ